MYDASDRKDVRRAEKAARLAERQDAEVLANIMSTSAGRSWLLRNVLEPCHIFATTFSSDPLRMAFAEGERNIGLRLFTTMVRECPDQYITMMREKEQTDAARRDADDPDRDDDRAVDDSANRSGGIVGDYGD